MIDKTKNIDSICRTYGITNYTICSDGSIDVDNDVDISNKNLTKLPLKFNIVSGFFFCFNNKLTTLEGSPKEISGGFYCQYNKLISLEGSPIKVGRNFSCNNNQLTSLKGSPKEVGMDFYCYYNQLIALEGGPTKVGGGFYCDRYINDIEPYIIIDNVNGTDIAKIDYNRYRKVNDRDKKINNILT